MSESITNLADAVAKHGALPMPVGPEPLSVERLAEIEARAAEATPGPWCTDSWEIYQGSEYEPGLSFWIGETCRGTSSLEQDRADAAFVAAARSDVPALVTEVRRQRAERAAIGNEVARFGIYGAALPATRALVKRADELVTENAELRARVAELEAERHETNESLSAAAEALRVQRDRIAELEALKPATHQTCRTCGAGYIYGEPCSVCVFQARMAAQGDVSPQVVKLRGILAGQREAIRGPEPAAKCHCAEPDADPYACEADDCEGEFSELNPFGGGPVQGHDAKVSRTCGCGWRTTVWHVNDGSAEEELHGHVVRVHGGVYPGVSR